MATVQLFAGIPYVALLWAAGLRRAPRLSADNVKTLASSGFFLMATHVGGVISFGAGAISFTHIIKVRPRPMPLQIFSRPSLVAAKAFRVACSHRSMVSSALGRGKLKNKLKWKYLLALLSTPRSPAFPAAF